MERLTRRWGPEEKQLSGQAICEFDYCPEDTTCASCVYGQKNNRLADIEDILGSEYDLDHLKQIIEADREGHVHIGRCLECKHYEGLAECEYLGGCGGSDWICGWFEPKKSSLKERKVNPKSIEVNAEVN